MSPVRRLYSPNCREQPFPETELGTVSVLSFYISNAMHDYREYFPHR
jgi:hypothetical protein